MSNNEGARASHPQRHLLESQLDMELELNSTRNVRNPGDTPAEETGPSYRVPKLKVYYKNVFWNPRGPASLWATRKTLDTQLFLLKTHCMLKTATKTPLQPPGGEEPSRRAALETGARAGLTAGDGKVNTCKMMRRWKLKKE